MHCARCLRRPLPVNTTSRGRHGPLFKERACTGVRGEYSCQHDDPVLINNCLLVLQITTSLKMLDKDSPPPMATATASTSHTSDSEAYRAIAQSFILTLHVKPRTHSAPSPMGPGFVEKGRSVPNQTKNRPAPLPYSGIVLGP